MTGGFIGVDIFFVISGYLITGIIFKELLQKQKFSYGNFYNRRIKRIFPALLFVLSFILILGCIVLMREYLKILASTIFNSARFSVNLQFLVFQKDYFGPDTTKNPLLNLWSLSVEQQFYFIWPLFISVIFCKFKKRLFSMLLAFTILSFILSILIVYINTNYAFYFPLFRFWQMSVGGLIATIKIKISNKKMINFLSIFGTIMILTMIWIIDQNSLFPGFWALIPTLSAAFIIISGNEAIINKYILSSKFFIFIGKISYPLYLWHWPLLVFGRKLFPEGSTSIFSHSITIVIISILLSIFTYYFIQNPLRFTKNKKIVLVLVLWMIILAIISLDIEKRPFQYSYLQRKIKGMLQFQENQKFQPIIMTEQDIKNKPYLYIKMKQQQLASSNYEKSLIPSNQNDFYLKNGKWLVNSSKNKNRKKPTIQKIFRKYGIQNYSPILLQKRIQPSSKYYTERLDIFKTFDIVNQGKQNLVMVVGDSHGQMVSKRFLQLYIQSIIEKKQQNFPTVISIAHSGKLFIPCYRFYDDTFQFIKRHKPKRVIFVHRWLLYLTYYDKDGPLQSVESMKNRCNYGSFQTKGQTFKDVLSYIELFVKAMKQIETWGTQVYVTTINPQDYSFYAAAMIDLFGIIDKNIQPFKLSDFREKNKQKINLLQSALKKAEINIIDLSNHQCWEDNCELFTPEGHPIYMDSDHYNQQYAQHWASSLDFLTQF